MPESFPEALSVGLGSWPCRAESRFYTLEDWTASKLTPECEDRNTYPLYIAYAAGQALSRAGHGRGKGVVCSVLGYSVSIPGLYCSTHGAISIPF